MLCMALGGEHSARIIHCSRRARSSSSRARSPRCRSVASEVVTTVLEEFQQVSKAVESVARGGVEYAQQILETALGSSRARVMLEKIQEQMVDTGLKRLRNAAPEVLAGILRGEHPQTIALILAHLDPPGRQGRRGMEPELAGDVLYRIARMDKISPEMLALVEAGLAARPTSRSPRR